MLRLHIRKQVSDDWNVSEIAQRDTPHTWEAVFADAHQEIEDVAAILATQPEYYPLKKDIFNAFHQTPLPKVRVVIFGQDPYHQAVTINGQTVPRATGLSFSVRKGDSIPSSLQNIFKELHQSVRGFQKPDNGDLTSWCEQGVLMLNSCLTVRPREAGSHGEIWHGFIRKVLKAISVVNPNCIYVMWGKEAQKLAGMIVSPRYTLTAAHPSGFSAARGFFGCNHFNQINDILVKLGGMGITWSIPSRSEGYATTTHVSAPIPQLAAPLSFASSVTPSVAVTSTPIPASQFQLPGALSFLLTPLPAVTAVPTPKLAPVPTAPAAQVRIPPSAPIPTSTTQTRTPSKPVGASGPATGRAAPVIPQVRIQPIGHRQAARLPNLAASAAPTITVHVNGPTTNGGHLPTIPTLI